MNRRICHVTITHPVFDTRIFKKECASLAKAGYEVILIAPHDKEEVVNGVQIIPVIKWTGMLERLLNAPKEAVRIATELNADLYHFHDPELFPAMVSFAKRTGKKVIWDAHENYGDTLVRLNSLKIQPISWLGAKWFARMEKQASKKHFAGVVTITSIMSKKYEDAGAPTCIVANYADTSTISYEGQYSLSKKPRLLSSGSHFRGRAVEEIADSFALIREEVDAEVHFVGRFSDASLELNVKQKLEQVQPEGNDWLVKGDVSYPYLVNEAIPEAWMGLVLFDTSDPNNRNGLPNRLFECWANGVPVITTAGTEVARLTEEINGGIVIPENSPKYIAEAFISVAKNQVLRDEMSINAFEATRDHYNWQRSFEDLKEFYSAILGK